MALVFVYGTLKRGGSNHRFLAGQRFVGAARTRPRFRLVLLDGYPGMIESAPGLAVEGELWEVDAACLAELDRLEGVDEGLYARVPVGLAEPHASRAAEAYLYLGDTARRLDLGARFDI